MLRNLVNIPTPRKIVKEEFQIKKVLILNPLPVSFKIKFKYELFIIKSINDISLIIALPIEKKTSTFGIGLYLEPFFSNFSKSLFKIVDIYRRFKYP